jgi:hypothetical protein
VYAPSGEQPVLDRRHEDLTAAEKEVDLFFSDQNNIDRLIKFLALEEKKGKDKFNCYRFIMFKVRQCSAVTLFLCLHCCFNSIVTCYSKTCVKSSSVSKENFDVCRESVTE